MQSALLLLHPWMLQNKNPALFTQRQNAKTVKDQITKSLDQCEQFLLRLFLLGWQCFFFLPETKNGGFRRFNLTWKNGNHKTPASWIQEFCDLRDAMWSKLIRAGSDFLGGCIQATPMPRVFLVLFGGKIRSIWIPRTFVKTQQAWCYNHVPTWNFI